jgi:hypothetical protein
MNTNPTITVGWPDTMPDVPEDHHGWLSGEVRRTLTRVIAETDPYVVVEIGSWLGRSSRYILSCHPTLHLYCIDTWEGSEEHHRRPDSVDRLPTLYDTFIRNMWPYRDRCTPVKAHSRVGMSHIAGMGVVPAVVYIDGDHSAKGVRSDLTRALARWPHAHIIGDDWTWDSVRKGVHGAMLRMPKRMLIAHGKAWEVVRR